MKISRSRFKLALRTCKLNEEQMRADSMAESCTQNDYEKFWKKVKQVNMSLTAMSEVIKYVKGEEKISRLWAQHYGNLIVSKMMQINNMAMPLFKVS